MFKIDPAMLDVSVFATDDLPVADDLRSLDDEPGIETFAAAASEAWDVHQALRDFDHQNARAALLANAAANFQAIVMNRSAADSLLVWRDCLQCEPSFEPGADCRLLLARIAIEQGNPRAALELLTRFDSRFRGDPRIPGAFALAHEALTALGDSARAARIHQSLTTRFPGHPVCRQAAQSAD